MSKHEYFTTKEEFISYLEETLIPDLRREHLDATADDFEQAIYWVKVETRKSTIYKECLSSESQIIANLLDLTLKA